MADTYGIVIDQGATLDLLLTWRDSAGVLISNSGYTARMKIKDDAGATLESLTNTDGLVLGGAAGTVRIQRSATQTAAYTWTRGVYDLEMVSATGVVTRLLEGVVVVNTNVTT